MTPVYFSLVFRIFADETSQFLAPYETSVKRPEPCDPPVLADSTTPYTSLAESYPNIVSKI